MSNDDLKRRKVIDSAPEARLSPASPTASNKGLYMDTDRLQKSYTILRNSAERLSVS